MQSITIEQFGGDAFASGDGSAAAVDTSLTVDQTVVSAGLDSVAFLP